MKYQLVFFGIIGLFFLFHFSSAVQGRDEPLAAMEGTLQDLNAELKRTLDSVTNHYERIQTHLELTGVGREPELDELIGVLEKEQQSLYELFQGLGSLLLKMHAEEPESRDQSTPPIEDLQDRFRDAIARMEQYISEREQYWEQNGADPVVMLEEELRTLYEQEAAFEAMLDSLIDSLGDSWKDVIADWGDALGSWKSQIKDLIPTEEGN